MENELFRLHGWTVHIFANSDDYIVFMQMIASSGHEPSAIVGKTKSSEPPIELSFLPIARVNNTCFFKDLWQGTKFSEKMIYLVESINITSRG